MMYQQFHGIQCIPALQPLILFGRYPETYIPGTDYLMHDERFSPAINDSCSFLFVRNLS